MHIAIIGAGLAGLSCARSLQSASHHVVLYEKSRGVSGRMSTRQTELGGFDLGAQYFTATSEQFKKQVTAWRKSGWVAPWEGKLVTLDHGASKATGRNDRARPRFAAAPAMNELGKNLAQGLEVRTDQLVRRLEAYGAQWLLSVESELVPVPATAGPFDAVVVAVPADQAVSLLAPSKEFSARANRARLSPCWSLMLGFRDPLDLGYDGAWIDGSRLGWIARESSKPGHRPGERWVAHATPEWSLEHLEDDPERARDKLLRAFHEATGSQVQPLLASAHRWRFAQAVEPLEAECLWDGNLRIGACGDWFACGLPGNGRIENAYLSGRALAESIA